MTHHTLNRRELLLTSALLGTGMLAFPHGAFGASIETLRPEEPKSGLRIDPAPSPLQDGAWYICDTAGQTLEYRFPMGLLTQGAYLVSDILVDGNALLVFSLTLKEGENGRVFHLSYKGLNQAQARIRFPLAATDQNRWLLGREGAWLKPLCGGDRVDLSQVDRMTLRVSQKAPQDARWCQTPFHLVHEEPQSVQNPILPKGKLLDEMGQSTIHAWPAKTKSVEEMTARLQAQAEAAPKQKWPDGFNTWGGWDKKKLQEGTGFFTKTHDGKRWWLVDPDGYAFWSTGMDCVISSVESVFEGLENALTWLPNEENEYAACFSGQRRRRAFNYLGANFIRTFGLDAWHAKWAEISLAELRRLGFNTVANWSEWKIARQARFPYVIPLNTRLPRSQQIYRDFPDVFHPDFQKDAEEYGKQLEEVVDDPALIGYFLMNEPTWGFSSESPAAGMLFNAPQCESRKALRRFLQERYSSIESLSDTWGLQTTWDAIEAGSWTTPLTDAAKKDLFDFSEIMVERFFGALSDACKAVDPHHMNLGIRYQSVPPQWTIKGMSKFDVFSMNCYQKSVPFATCEEIHTRLGMPVMIGEFHFGALDVGLPSPGLVHVKNQVDRGRAYRYYVEDAAANPYCVGVHYFTLYDQSAMGRFDGENYNIGFLDTCNRPYEAFGNAALDSHRLVYPIADGSQKPFANPPEYLPRLF